MFIKFGLVLKLLSAIVKLRHLQSSCLLGTVVDFCFCGSHAKKLCSTFMIRKTLHYKQFMSLSIQPLLVSEKLITIEPHFIF